MKRRKHLRLLVFLTPLALIFSQCFHKSPKQDPRGSAFAGSESCINCHKDIYHSYLHTAHFMASRPACRYTIQGSFAGGHNQFIFNRSLKVTMQRRDTGFYQTAYVNGKPEQTEPFNIVFGGIKGQTYGYWLTNEMFQLPISYISKTHQWVNSPGYSMDRAAFDRPIGTRCLNCHASYIKSAKPEIPDFYNNDQAFDKNTLVYSVDCERCHGPAAAHVKFQTEHPEVKSAKYITTFSSLTREQKINMCAVCHSGTSTHAFRSTFSYKPGDALSKYMHVPAITAADYQHIDVHGNQRGLLETSKCFIGSNMDCSTCHDVHINQSSNTMLYVNKCLSCHQTEKHRVCKLTNMLSTSALMNNCINCHMPALHSKLIVIGDDGTLIHTHHIAVYPSVAKKILDSLSLKSK